MASSEQIAKEYYDKGINLIHINSIELAIDNLNMAKTIYEELDDSTNERPCYCLWNNRLRLQDATQMPIRLRLC